MIQQQKSILKSVLPHIGAIICFLITTMVYFSPLLEGKVLPQGDVYHFEGASQELREYYEKEGVASVWTGSMFSGMPAYQIGIWGPSPNLIDYIEKPLKALGSSSAGPIFTGMLMAYLLFILMGFGVIPSILGALAYSFSSYNIIIIDAGHVTKVWAIAYIPLIIAGVLTTFRNKYLLGGILTALGICLQIKSNHLQITYYTALLCFILYMGFIIRNILIKDYKGILKTTGVLLFAVLLGILSNLSGFYANYEMAQESIRGKSELSQPTEAEQQSSGLDKDYAFAWSYGKSETLSLLIPNIHGGATGGTLDTDSHIYQQLKNNGFRVPSDGVQAYTYWGDQPFTSGPVYFGAVICFLFLLGMFIIKSRWKWVLLAATIFFIFLSWGRHFELFNDFFFYYFPFYNKFRAVSMALVIPALTMLIVAIWAIKEFFDRNTGQENLVKSLYWAGGISAGICIFFWIFPDFFFNFTSVSDEAWKTQYPDWFYNALLEDRKDLLASDALRSLIFVILAFLILWSSIRIKIANTALICSAFLTVLVLTDLWNIDKRYLNNDSFLNKISYQSQRFNLANADKIILQDKSPSYRVLNLNNPFNESATSYYHKSIGGYHAAKLKRYQELIDYRLERELREIISSFSSNDIDNITASFANLNSLNMLNAKYIIFDPAQPPLYNPYALGNAWFVNDYYFINNADEEINALDNLNILNTAVIDKRFESEVSGLKIIPDSTSIIEMTEYKPDRVQYKTKTNSEQLAVFSEIYYANGWKAYIDGNPTPHFRADWTLRAMRIPAGEHEIEFRFIPETYYMTRTISTVSSAVLILLLLGCILLPFIRKEKNKG